MRATSLLSFFFWCWLCLSLCRGVDVPQETKGGFACGLNATYIFLNRAGHHVNYEKLEREFMAQSPPDSLLAIRNILGLHGCPTVGINADADYFLQNQGPAIVFLQLSGYGRKTENHFAYMSNATRQGGAVLLDPVFDINEPCSLTWDHFSRIFQKIALVPHD